MKKHVLFICAIIIALVTISFKGESPTFEQRKTKEILTIPALTSQSDFDNAVASRCLYVVPGHCPAHMNWYLLLLEDTITPVPATEVSIWRQTGKSTFGQLFGSTGKDTASKCFTLDQIVKFAQQYRSYLISSRFRKSGYRDYFLFQSKGKYYVADVTPISISNRSGRVRSGNWGSKFNWRIALSIYDLKEVCTLETCSGTQFFVPATAH